MPTKNSVAVKYGVSSSLGSAIRMERRRAELSQQELAARVGVSQGTISFWERDIETPSLDNLVRLLARLPDLVDAVRQHRNDVLVQLQQIERVLFDGRCACENCPCGQDK